MVFLVFCCYQQVYDIFNMSCLWVILQVRGRDGVSTPQNGVDCLCELCASPLSHSSSSQYSLIRVNRNQLAVPPFKLYTYVPAVWNSLSGYLREPTLFLDVFQRYLKSYLFARF